MQKVVRCYAEGRGGQWEAICLDFDIAVQGTSFDEVYHSLNKAIAEYYEYVEGLPEAERKRFLTRKAPLSASIKLALGTLTGILLDRRTNDRTERHGYTMLRPA